MLNHLIPAQDIHKIIRGGEAWLSWVSSVKVKSDVTAKYGDPYSEFVLCIYPIQSAHTQQWTHTHSSEHTPGAVGSQSCFGARGAVRCLAQGHLSRGIEGEESAEHSLPPPTIPAGPETRTYNLSTL